MAKDKVVAMNGVKEEAKAYIDYENDAEKVKSPKLKATLHDVADEEVAHMGEFAQRAADSDPEIREKAEEGMKEAKEQKTEPAKKSLRSMKDLIAERDAENTHTFVQKSGGGTYKMNRIGTVFLGTGKRYNGLMCHHEEPSRDEATGKFKTKEAKQIQGVKVEKKDMDATKSVAGIKKAAKKKGKKKVEMNFEQRRDALLKIWDEIKGLNAEIKREESRGSKYPGRLNYLYNEKSKLEEYASKLSAAFSDGELDIAQKMKYPHSEWNELVAALRKESLVKDLKKEIEAEKNRIPEGETSTRLDELMSALRELELPGQDDVPDENKLYLTATQQAKTDHYSGTKEMNDIAINGDKNYASLTDFDRPSRYDKNSGLGQHIEDGSRLGRAAYALWRGAFGNKDAKQWLKSQVNTNSRREAELWRGNTGEEGVARKEWEKVASKIAELMIDGKFRPSLTNQQSMAFNSLPIKDHVLDRMLMELQKTSGVSKNAGAITRFLLNFYNTEDIFHPIPLSREDLSGNKDKSSYTIDSEGNYVNGSLEDNDVVPDENGVPSAGLDSKTKLKPREFEQTIDGVQTNKEITVGTPGTPIWSRILPQEISAIMNLGLGFDNVNGSKEFKEKGEDENAAPHAMAYRYIQRYRSKKLMATDAVRRGRIDRSNLEIGAIINSMVDEKIDSLIKSGELLSKNGKIDNKMLQRIREMNYVTQDGKRNKYADNLIKLALNFDPYGPDAVGSQQIAKDLINGIKQYAAEIKMEMGPFHGVLNEIKTILVRGATEGTPNNKLNERNSTGPIPQNKFRKLYDTISGIQIGTDGEGNPITLSSPDDIRFLTYNQRKEKHERQKSSSSKPSVVKAYDPNGEVVDVLFDENMMKKIPKDYTLESSGYGKELDSEGREILTEIPDMNISEDIFADNPTDYDEGSEGSEEKYKSHHIKIGTSHPIKGVPSLGYPLHNVLTKKTDAKYPFWERKLTNGFPEEHAPKKKVFREATSEEAVGHLMNLYHKLMDYYSAYDVEGHMERYDDEIRHNFKNKEMVDAGHWSVPAGGSSDTRIWRDSTFDVERVYDTVRDNSRDISSKKYEIESLYATYVLKKWLGDDTTEISKSLQKEIANLQKVINTNLEDYKKLHDNFMRENLLDGHFLDLDRANKPEADKVDLFRPQAILEDKPFAGFFDVDDERNNYSLRNKIHRNYFVQDERGTEIFGKGNGKWVLDTQLYASHGYPVITKSKIFKDPMQQTIEINNLKENPYIPNDLKMGLSDADSYHATNTLRKVIASNIIAKKHPEFKGRLFAGYNKLSTSTEDTDRKEFAIIFKEADDRVSGLLSGITPALRNVTTADKILKNIVTLLPDSEPYTGFKQYLKDYEGRIVSGLAYGNIQKDDRLLNVKKFGPGLVNLVNGLNIDFLKANNRGHEFDRGDVLYTDRTHQTYGGQNTLNADFGVRGGSDYAKVLAAMNGYGRSIYKRGRGHNLNEVIKAIYTELRQNPDLATIPDDSYNEYFAHALGVMLNDEYKPKTVYAERARAEMAERVSNALVIRDGKKEDRTLADEFNKAFNSIATEKKGPPIPPSAHEGQWFDQKTRQWREGSESDYLQQQETDSKMKGILSNIDDAMVNGEKLNRNHPDIEHLLRLIASDAKNNGKYTKKYFPYIKQVIAAIKDGDIHREGLNESEMSSNEIVPELFLNDKNMDKLLTIVRDINDAYSRRETISSDHPLYRAMITLFKYAREHGLLAGSSVAPYIQQIISNTLYVDLLKDVLDKPLNQVAASDVQKVLDEIPQRLKQIMIKEYPGLAPSNGVDWDWGNKEELLKNVKHEVLRHLAATLGRHSDPSYTIQDAVQIPLTQGLIHNTSLPGSFRDDSGHIALPYHIDDGRYHMSPDFDVLNYKRPQILGESKDVWVSPDARRIEAEAKKWHAQNKFGYAPPIRVPSNDKEIQEIVNTIKNIYAHGSLDPSTNDKLNQLFSKYGNRIITETYLSGPNGETGREDLRFLRSLDRKTKANFLINILQDAGTKEEQIGRALRFSINMGVPEIANEILEKGAFDKDLLNKYRYANIEDQFHNTPVGKKYNYGVLYGMLLNDEIPDFLNDQDKKYLLDKYKNNLLDHINSKGNFILTDSQRKDRIFEQEERRQQEIDADPYNNDVDPNILLKAYLDRRKALEKYNGLIANLNKISNRYPHPTDPDKFLSEAQHHDLELLNSGKSKSTILNRLFGGDLKRDPTTLIVTDKDVSPRYFLRTKDVHNVGSNNLSPAEVALIEGFHPQIGGALQTIIDASKKRTLATRNQVVGDDMTDRGLYSDWAFRIMGVPIPKKDTFENRVKAMDEQVNYIKDLNDPEKNKNQKNKLRREYLGRVWGIKGAGKTDDDLLTAKIKELEDQGIKPDNASLTAEERQKYRPVSGVKDPALDYITKSRSRENLRVLLSTFNSIKKSGHGKRDILLDIGRAAKYCTTNHISKASIRVAPTKDADDDQTETEVYTPYKWVNYLTDRSGTNNLLKIHAQGVPITREDLIYNGMPPETETPEDISGVLNYAIKLANTKIRQLQSSGKGYEKYPIGSNFIYTNLLNMIQNYTIPRIYKEMGLDPLASAKDLEKQNQHSEDLKRQMESIRKEHADNPEVGEKIINDIIQEGQDYHIGRMLLSDHDKKLLNQIERIIADAGDYSPGNKPVAHKLTKDKLHLIQNNLPDNLKEIADKYVSLVDDEDSANLLYRDVLKGLNPMLSKTVEAESQRGMSPQSFGLIKNPLTGAWVRSDSEEAITGKKDTKTKLRKDMFGDTIPRTFTYFDKNVTLPMEQYYKLCNNVVKIQKRAISRHKVFNPNLEVNQDATLNSLKSNFGLASVLSRVPILDGQGHDLRFGDEESHNDFYFNIGWGRRMGRSNVLDPSDEDEDDDAPKSDIETFNETHAKISEEEEGEGEGEGEGSGGEEKKEDGDSNDEVDYSDYEDDSGIGF